MKFYVSALVGIIKVTLRNARCNNKDLNTFFQFIFRARSITINSILKHVSQVKMNHVGSNSMIICVTKNTLQTQCRIKNHIVTAHIISDCVKHISMNLTSWGGGEMAL